MKARIHSLLCLLQTRPRVPCCSHVTPCTTGGRAPPALSSRGKGCCTHGDAACEGHAETHTHSSGHEVRV